MLIGYTWNVAQLLLPLFSIKLDIFTWNTGALPYSAFVILGILTDDIYYAQW
jgi:hypothetical protein